MATAGAEGPLVDESGERPKLAYTVLQELSGFAQGRSQQTELGLCFLWLQAPHACSSEDLVGACSGGCTAWESTSTCRSSTR